MATTLKPGFTYYLLTNDGKEKHALVHALNDTINNINSEHNSQNKIISSSDKSKSII